MELTCSVDHKTKRLMIRVIHSTNVPIIILSIVLFLYLTCDQMAAKKVQG
jgi:hypothetical protein